MENASKALLIAAAILIVIVLIAFGVSVLDSSGDVSSQAISTGEAISEQAGQASNSANNVIQGLNSWLK